MVSTWGGGGAVGATTIACAEAGTANAKHQQAAESAASEPATCRTTMSVSYTGNRQTKALTPPRSSIS